MKKLGVLILIFLLKTGYCQSDCDTISTFPWAEGFEENGTELPLCWTQKRGWDDKNWTIVENFAHSGNYKAFISLYCPSDTGHEQWLITPVFDLSDVEDPVLSFCYIAFGGGFLYVYCEDSAGWRGVWCSSRNTMGWQQEVIHLPYKSSNYKIIFAGIHLGGGYAEIQLDDIFISDGEIEDLSVLSYHTDNCFVSPNPVRNHITILGVEPQMMTIYNTIGQIVFTQTDYSNSIDVSHLANGIYFLKIVLEDGSQQVRKFVKE